MDAVKMLSQERGLILKATSGLTGGQLLSIPAGRKNNILWNLGHILVTQQLLHYGLTGQALHIPDELVAQCRKETSPAAWGNPPAADEVWTLLAETPAKLVADYEAGIFSNCQEYTTSNGVVIRNIDGAIAFNQFHEGAHLGIILSIMREIGRC